VKLPALKAMLPGKKNVYFRLIRDRGNFCDDKMPGYHLLNRAAATTLHFAAC
jgi:hypothetical protein